MNAVIETGVIRAFASLSYLNDRHTEAICAKGFLLFSCSERGRQDLCQRRKVLHALFSLVKSSQKQTLLIVGKAVCNILSAASTRQAVVAAGGLSVIKIIATFEFDEMRESAARVIIDLALDTSLHPMLLREPLVAVLIYVLQDSNIWSLECAIHAFSCLAKSESFRVSLIEKGTAAALIGAVLSGRVINVDVAEEVVRSLCYLSYVEDMAETIIVHGHILVGLNMLYRMGLCTPKMAMMIAIILRNLSAVTSVCENVVDEDAVLLLGDILATFPDNAMLKRAAVHVLHHLAKVEALHAVLMSQGFMRMLSSIVSARREVTNASSTCDASIDTDDDALSAAGTKQGIHLSRGDVYCLAMALQLTSQSENCRLLMVDGDVVGIFRSLLGEVNELAFYEIACSLGNLASSKECRVRMVQDGATELVISLSQTSRVTDTQHQCSLALGYLSEAAVVKDGTVSSLLMLSLKLDGQGRMSASNSLEMGSIASQGLMNGGSIVAADSVAKAGGAVGSTAGASGSTALRVAIVDGLERSSVLSDEDSRAARLTSAHSHKSALKTYSLDELRNMTDNEELETSRFYRMFKEDDLFFTGGGITAAVKAEELKLLTFSYSPFQYEITPFAAKQVTGGISSKSKIELPLPGIAEDREVEQQDRQLELFKLEIILDPLDKDETPSDSYNLQTQHADNILRSSSVEMSFKAKTVAVAEEAAADELPQQELRRHRKKPQVPGKLRRKTSHCDPEPSAPGSQSPGARLVRKASSPNTTLLSRNNSGFPDTSRSPSPVPN